MLRRAAVLAAPQRSLWFAGLMIITQIYGERSRRESIRYAILGLQHAIEEQAAPEPPSTGS
jgi:hypothetical protein